MKHRRGEALTDDPQEPLWLGLPPNAEEVDGNSCGDNCESYSTFHRGFPNGHHDEEQAGQYEGKWQQNIDLVDRERWKSFENVIKSLFKVLSESIKYVCYGTFISHMKDTHCRSVQFNVALFSDNHHSSLAAQCGRTS